MHDIVSAVNSAFSGSLTSPEKLRQSLVSDADFEARGRISRRVVLITVVYVTSRGLVMLLLFLPCSQRGSNWLLFSCRAALVVSLMMCFMAGDFYAFVPWEFTLGVNRYILCGITMCGKIDGNICTNFVLDALHSSTLLSMCCWSIHPYWTIL